MKKIKFTVLSLMCISCFAILLSGCGVLEIKSAEIKSNTLANTLVLNEELDTSKAEAIVKYSDDTTKTVKAKDLEFGTIDTSTTGEKTLEISYEDFEFTYKIKVVATEADITAIIGFESNLINSFKANSSKKESSNEEFFNLDEPLFVGDDNDFHFDLNVSGFTLAGEPVDNVALVRTNIKIEMKNQNDEFVELTENQLQDYVTFDNLKNTFNFTEQAIGKVFNITIAPVNVVEGYEGAKGFSQEISVIDGYNVYNAYELSLYDNVHSAYNDFRIAKGIDDYYGNINAFVFQRDLMITKEDTTADFFWAEGDQNFEAAQTYTDQKLEGTLKDSTAEGIYKRQMQKNENFDFIGNYFAINVTEFPKAVVECNNNVGTPTGGINVGDGKMMTSHHALFYTIHNSSSAEKTTATAEWKNLNYIGNATLDSEVLLSGGIILSKMHNVNFTAKNTVMNDFYIGYMPEMYGNYYYEQCKGYNSFQTFMYAWGASHVLLNGCEFLDCGGPAIISEYTSGKKASNIDIVNTELRSLISGQEPYFQTYEGSGAAIGGIINSDAGLFGQTPTTFVAEQKQVGDKKVDYLNFMVFMNSAGLSFTSPSVIEGYTRVFESMIEYNTYYGLEGMEIDTSVTHGLNYDNGSIPKTIAAGGAPCFESASTGGYIYPTSQTTVNTEGNFYTADYINIYTQLGLGAIVKAYSRA